MSLVVAVKKTYNSYYSPNHIGTLNPNKKFKPISSEEKPQKNLTKAYQEAKEYKKFGKTKSQARDIMNNLVHSISPDKSLQEALKIMADLSIHHLLVLENKEIVGLISDRDLLKNIGTPEKPIKDVMTDKVLICNTDTEIRLISKVLYEEQISSIIVANEKYEPLGIITRSDLLNFIVRNMPHESWA
jgi:acetoin utilization protein AcuB